MQFTALEIYDDIITTNSNSTNVLGNLLIHIVLFYILRDTIIYI